MNAEAMPAMKNAKMPAITTPSVNVEASWRTAGGSRWISRWWERLDMAPSFIAVRPHPETRGSGTRSGGLIQEYSPSAVRTRNASGPPGVSFPSQHPIEEGPHHEHDHEQRQRHVDFAGARPS